MDLMLEQGTPLRAVVPLRTALTKLRPGSEVLTPLDADFLQVCLLAKDYRAALPVLAEEVLAIANPEDYNFKPKDLLRYFYYGGMIFVGTKQYGKALEYFKLVRVNVAELNILYYINFTTKGIYYSCCGTQCYHG